MASTVTGAFLEFAARLEPTAKQKADAANKHAGVRTVLADRLLVKRAFLTGSYARATMIRPPSDIDLFVVLDERLHARQYFYARAGEQRLLDRMHSILKASYPLTPVRKDLPAVHLDFSTYGFDVVPAFPREGGGYLIPSRSGVGWISTAPDVHARATRGMNAWTKNEFVPLVKIFKAWNVGHFHKLTGFHLEAALDVAWPRVLSPAGRRPVTFNSRAAATFRLLPGLALVWARPTFDPAGVGGRIDSYLTAQDRLLTRTRLLASWHQSKVALVRDGRGDQRGAIEKWREVFGDPFPCYG